MDIAKEQGMDIKQILAHNVLSSSTRFDGDLPAHANQSEIEPKLDLTQLHQKSTLATHVVVEFMSKMRQMPLGQFPNLGAVIDAISRHHHAFHTSQIAFILYLTPTSRCHHKKTSRIYCC